MLYWQFFSDGEFAGRFAKRAEAIVGAERAEDPQEPGRLRRGKFLNGFQKPHTRDERPPMVAAGGGEMVDKHPHVVRPHGVEEIREQGEAGVEVERGVRRERE